ncbi:hypothetical protein M9435_003863 [Picochlorum sp. BPE23]|nr:hypothetical protein M9435_003863 [Picochlorum sp. BPE23]
MEQYGNTSTFNIDSVIVRNIRTGSLYYTKSCQILEKPIEVIDEIFEKVDHVEPWMSGNARGPSTAFCLLYRLGEVRPTSSDIRIMIEHRDSPYIRAIGFLYLRYCCNPRELWKWCKKYVRDEEEFVPSPPGLGKTVTMGAFVRDVLLDQYYFETIFPRIPKLAADDIRRELTAMGLPTRPVGNAGQGGPSRREGDLDGGPRRPASVKESLSVALGQRAPNRAGVREHGRGLAPDDHGSRRKRPAADASGQRLRREEPRPRDHRDYERRSRDTSPPKRHVRDVFKEKPVFKKSKTMSYSAVYKY